MVEVVVGGEEGGEKGRGVERDWAYGGGGAGVWEGGRKWGKGIERGYRGTG